MNVFESASVNWWSGAMTVTCNGSDFAHLEFGDWKRLGVISLDDNEYQVVRDSIFSNDLFLRSNDAVLCQTRIQGFWNQAADLEFDSAVYTLKWSGWSSRAVLEKEGREIGAIEPQGWFSNSQRAAFPEYLPPLMAAFMFWMVAYKRKRDSSAAAAG
jgi:hypothetical protein